MGILAKLDLYKLVGIVTLCSMALVIFALPFFYESKLTTGIFQTDIYLLILLGALCWLNAIFYKGIIRHRIFQLLIVAALYVAIRTFLQPHPDAKSIQLCMVLVGSMGIFFFLCVSREQYGRYLLLAFLAIYSVEIIKGWQDAWQHQFAPLQIRAHFFNAGFFANYLIAPLPLLFAGALQKKGPTWQRWELLILCIAAAALVCLTTARAAIAGMIAGSIWLFFVTFNKAHLKKSLFIKLAITIGITAISIFFITLQLPATKTASVKGRVTIYKTCLTIIKDKPILGLGPNRFAAAYNNYQGDYLQNTQAPIEVQLLADDTFEAFNSLLQILTEYGLAGMFLLIVLVYAVIKNTSAPKTNTPHQWLYNGSNASLIAIFTASLCSNPFHVTPVWLLVLYHLSNITNVSQLVPAAQRKWGYKKIVVACCITSGFIFSIYYVTKLHQAEKTWYSASSTILFNGFKDTEAQYQKIYPLLKNNGYFLYNYGAEAGAAGNNKFSARLLEDSRQFYAFSNTYVLLGDSYTNLKEYDKAEVNYKKAIEMVPARIYPRYQLIQSYLKSGRINDAKELVNATLQWPVKIHSSLTNQLLDELQVLKIKLSATSD